MISCLLGFTNAGISTDPPEVQAQKVTLSFYAVPESTVRFNNGSGYVRLTIPAGVVWYPTSQGASCYDAIQKKACTMTVGPNTFTIQLSTDLVANKQFQFNIIGAVDNPDSEQPTNSFKLETSEGEVISSGLTFQAVRGSMTSLTLTPQSTVVGDSTSLVVRWKATHTLPKGGVAILTVPVWNPKQTDPKLQKSYIQGKEECTLLGTTTATIPCNY